MNPALSFGSFVKQHRIALGLTQAELAARVGCATVTLRKVENDALRPSVQIAERLAMALNIPLEDRGEFVRLARTALIGTPEPPSVPTPSPRPEEIGGEDLSGRSARGYELGERIGSGGFGAVYRAVQPGIEREVAVKIILPQYANHPDFIRRFEAEAHLVARLEHPHIVPLYDYWREPDAAYLVMRLLRGGCLTDPLKDGPLPLDFVLRILTQISGALHTAHRFGVIHRDLKPANILLDEDRNAYLADFGIAKNLGSPNLEDQTQAGAFIGSPAYISPEQIRSESILPQADIYCLGVMLYELLAGQQPFKGPTPIDYIVQHLNQPLPPLADHNPNAPAALDAIIQRATAKNPIDRYPDVLTMLADINAALGVQASGLRDQNLVVSDQPGTENWTLAPDANPFKGLRPFGEADAEDFFGRNTVIQELLGRLAEVTDVSRFLAVVGPSGSGKSSVVKAGLIPAIRRGALPGSENWFVVDFMPGAHPLEELEAALLRIAVNPPDSLLGQLKEEPRGLVRAVKRILPIDEMVELMLVIDQFEEVFTLVQDEAVRAHFMESLLAAVLDERSRIRVLLTLRADFTDRPLQYVDFGELLRQRTEFILPLTPDEMEQAITGPAEKAGLLLEPGLIARIVRELGDQPGTLPLLQYALTELFERRDGRKLTLAAYQEIGGVLGALGRRAEEIYSELDEPAQSAARQLFLRLVTLGEGVEDTRRRVLRTELSGLDSDAQNSSIIFQPLNAYGKARLLTFDHDPVTRGPTVEVAHEALLSEWPRLRGWLNESRADVRLQRVLAGAAAEWVAAGREAGLLLRGTRLTQLDAWAKETTLALTSDERAFLDASLAARRAKDAAELERQERERRLEQRSRNFLRSLVGVLIVATAIGLFLSIFAFNQRENAQEQAALAATSAAQSLANAELAEARQAEAESEAIARATAEANAIAEREIAQEQQAIAEEQARLAFSRELVAGSIVKLEIDPDLSMLLALQALEQSVTFQAQQALHNAVMSPLLLRSASSDKPDVGFGIVAYSSDGKQIANVSWGPDWLNTQVRDANTLEVLFEVPGFLIIGGGGRDADYWVVDPGTDVEAPADIQIWDSTGKLLSTFTPPLLWGETWGVDISPDMTQIAYSNTTDGLVYVFNMATGQLIKTLGEPAPNHYGGLQFSPDGTGLLLSSTEGKFLTLWDVSSGVAVVDLIADEPLRSTFSRDGRRFAYANGSGIVIVESSSGQKLLTINEHSGGILSLNFSADGTRLVSSAFDATVRIWDSNSGQNLFRLGSDSSIGWYEASISPDGSEVVATTGNGKILVWGLSPSDRREWLTVPGVGDWCGIAVSPNGRLLAAPLCNDSVALLDASSGQTLSALTVPTEVEGDMAFPVYSPDGTRLAAVNLSSDDSSADTVFMWDLATGQETLALTGHTNRIWKVAFSPDGTRLATISYDGTAKIWDMINGIELYTMGAFTETLDIGAYPIDLAFSQDGKRLATAGGSSVRVWDTETGEELLAAAPWENSNTTFAYSVAFSPDGTRLAIGIMHGNAGVWDAATGEHLFTLSGHTRSVTDIAYSPDGKQIATVSVDGTTRLWDASTGVAQLILTGHTAQVIQVNYSPDGTRLFTQGGDGTVIVYALELEDLIDIALAHLTRWFTPAECLQYLHTETCPPDIRP